jgi:hypothetical protein
MESIDRRGRLRASLPDGTVLIASSRQPFLDSARALIRAGHNPESWLEAWRRGATAFALKGRLRIAASLSIDETRTAFTKWKAFSSSAVPAGVAYSGTPAITLASVEFELTQPLPVSSAGELESSPSASTR